MYTVTRALLISVLLGSLLASQACTQAIAPDITTPQLALPATFVGDLPCASCDGIQHQLNLLEDNTFLLSRVWLGENGKQVNFGTWELDAAQKVMTLSDAGEAVMKFEVLSRKQFRLLDRYGKPIASGLPYELDRADEFISLTATPLLNGMFSYYADAARFTECKTGRSYPVAMEKEYLTLEQQYSAIGEPGKPVLASIAGSIEPRAKADGAGSEPTAVVDRYAGLWPEDSCANHMTNASLYDTYWRIIRLGNKALDGVPGIREPRVVLRAHDDLYSATVGCNSISGGYEAGASNVSFKPGRTTLMACLPPVSPLERALVETLGNASSWEIAGQVMELSDAQGQQIALFKAVSLP